MKHLEKLLGQVETKVQRRKQPSACAKRIAGLHNITLPRDLGRLLKTMDEYRTETFESGDTSDLASCWGLFGATDVLAPEGDRPFETAVAHDRRHFTGGFGLLQLVGPMVPVAKLERRDNVFLALSDGNPLVLLPQEALFDIAASDLYFVGDSLEALAARLQSAGVSGVLDGLEHEWEHSVRSRYLKVVPFVYLLAMTGSNDDDELVDLTLFEELVDLADHRPDKTPVSQAVSLDAWQAFYDLSRAYFFGMDAACATLSATCTSSKSLLVRDMGRAYGALLDGRRLMGGVRMAEIRDVLRNAGWGVPKPSVPAANQRSLTPAAPKKVTMKKVTTKKVTAKTSTPKTSTTKKKPPSKKAASKKPTTKKPTTKR